MASSTNSPCTSCWLKATSNYHKGTYYCGPCYIFGKEQEWYDHYNGLTSEVQMFFADVVPFQAIAAFVTHIVERHTDTA